jgi:hypothetical protein
MPVQLLDAEFVAAGCKGFAPANQAVRHTINQSAFDVENDQLLG